MCPRTRLHDKELGKCVLFFIVIFFGVGVGRGACMRANIIVFIKHNRRICVRKFIIIHGCGSCIQVYVCVSSHCHRSLSSFTFHFFIHFVSNFLFFFSSQNNQHLISSGIDVAANFMISQKWIAVVAVVQNTEKEHQEKKLIILIYISLPPLSKSTRAVKDHRPVFHLCISLYLLIANNNKKNWRSHYLFDDVAAAAALFCLA